MSKYTSEWCGTNCCTIYILLWYPMSIYVSEDRYDSFYLLALYNLVLGLTDILLKSKLFKWWMSSMVTWPYMAMLPS